MGMTKEEKIRGLYNLKEYLVKNPIELDRHKSLPITLIDYAIESLEQQPCEDCISREAVLEVINNPLNIRLEDIIRGLPSVQPIRPKGRWMATENEDMNIVGYYCSCCDLPMETEEKTTYCPRCGAKMEVENESNN